MKASAYKNSYKKNFKSLVIFPKKGLEIIFAVILIHKRD